MIKVETGIYTRISKRIAKKMYNDGKSVYVVPSNVYPSDNNYMRISGQRKVEMHLIRFIGWMKPCEMTYTADMQQRDLDYPTLAYQHAFDYRIANYQYYNCNHELGYYTAFYVKVEG